MIRCPNWSAFENGQSAINDLAADPNQGSSCCGAHGGTGCLCVNSGSPLPVSPIVLLGEGRGQGSQLIMGTCACLAKDGTGTTSREPCRSTDSLVLLILSHEEGVECCRRVKQASEWPVGSGVFLGERATSELLLAHAGGSAPDGHEARPRQPTSHPDFAGAGSGTCACPRSPALPMGTAQQKLPHHRPILSYFACFLLLPKAAEEEDLPKQKERTHFTVRLTEAKPVDKVKLIKEIKNYIQGINLVQVGLPVPGPSSLGLVCCQLSGVVPSNMGMGVAA